MAANRLRLCEAFVQNQDNLQFPDFHRGDDPQLWIPIANQMFNHYHVPDEYRVLLARSYMDYDVYVYLQSILPCDGSWNDWCWSLYEEFHKSVYGFNKFRFTSFVDQYNSNCDQINSCWQAACVNVKESVKWEADDIFEESIQAPAEQQVESDSGLSITSVFSDYAKTLQRDDQLEPDSTQKSTPQLQQTEKVDFEIPTHEDELNLCEIMEGSSVITGFSIASEPRKKIDTNSALHVFDEIANRKWSSNKVHYSLPCSNLIIVYNVFDESSQRTRGCNSIDNSEPPCLEATYEHDHIVWDPGKQACYEGIKGVSLHTGILDAKSSFPDHFFMHTSGFFADQKEINARLSSDYDGTNRKEWGTKKDGSYQHLLNFLFRPGLHDAACLFFTPRDICEVTCIFVITALGMYDHSLAIQLVFDIVLVTEIILWKEIMNGYDNMCLGNKDMEKARPCFAGLYMVLFEYNGLLGLVVCVIALADWLGFWMKWISGKGKLNEKAKAKQITMVGSPAQVIIEIWLVGSVVWVLSRVLIGDGTRWIYFDLAMNDWKFTTLPLLSNDGWLMEFNEYKHSPEYKRVNKGIVSDFALNPHIFPVTSDAEIKEARKPYGTAAILAYDYIWTDFLENQKGYGFHDAKMGFNDLENEVRAKYIGERTKTGDNAFFWKYFKVVRRYDHSLAIQLSIADKLKQLEIASSQAQSFIKIGLEEPTFEYVQQRVSPNHIMMSILVVKNNIQKIQDSYGQYVVIKSKFSRAACVFKSGDLIGTQNWYPKVQEYKNVDVLTVEGLEAGMKQSTSFYGAEIYDQYHVTFTSIAAIGMCVHSFFVQLRNHSLAVPSSVITSEFPMSSLRARMLFRSGECHSPGSRHKHVPSHSTVDWDFNSQPSDQVINRSNKRHRLNHLGDRENHALHVPLHSIKGSITISFPSSKI